MRILLLSKNKQLAGALREHNHLVDCVDGKDDFFEKICLHDYSLIVLSVADSSINITRFIDEIREEKIVVPIVLLTSYINTSSQIASIQNYHAQSYFGYKNPSFCLGNLSFDFSRRCFCIDNKTLGLTLREFALLEQLYFNHKQFISKEKLMRLVLRDTAAIQSNLPEVYVYRLRTKLRQHCATVKIIHHRHLGYQIRGI